MKKNQRGFSAVEALFVLIAIGVLGFVCWYVWARSHRPAGTSTSSVSSSNAQPQTVNDGWKTVSENGLTVSYPKSWDTTEEDYQRLQVGGKVDGDVIAVGFGAPFGYKYTHEGTWEHVDLVDGKKVDGSQPKAAPASVAGADSTVIIGSGDGGCGGSIIGFAYKGSLYTVSLPWECDKTVHGSAGISGEVVAKDLNGVIRSIRVNGT